jgi:anti-sigma-K factor RskA
MTGHERWTDAAGAYVLEAMPPDEREAFEAHLAACAACREEVEELRPAAAALPMASPPMLPPPELKGRIMAEVEREAALLAQAGEGADRVRPRRRVRLPLLSGWRLAPVAAALLVAGVLVGALIGRGPGDHTIEASVMAPGASAEVRVEGGKGTLVAERLPAPPRGRVYEVWVMPEGSKTPRPTNVLFVPRGDGSAEAAIPGDVSDVSQVLVTDEPPAGSDTPTGDVLVSAAMS